MFELVSYNTYKKKVKKYQIGLTIGFIIIGVIAAFNYYSHLKSPKQMTSYEEYQQATKVGSYVEMEVKRQMLFDLDMRVQPSNGSLVGLFKKDTYYYMVAPIDATFLPIRLKENVYRSIQDDVATVTFRGQLSPMYEYDYYEVERKIEERGINPRGVAYLESYELKVVTPLESIYPFFTLMGGILLFALFYLPQMHRRLAYLKMAEGREQDEED